MSQFTRRDFLKTTVAVSAVAASGGALTAAAAKRSATDWVTLGNSGVKVTRLAFGTGTRGGMIQRQLGQDEFHAPRPARLRPRHPLLRNRRFLPRHARDAGHRLEGDSARYLPAHDQDGSAATRPRGLHRQAAHRPGYGVHRHCAVARPSHRGVGAREGANPRRALRGQTEEDCSGSRRFRPWLGAAAHLSGRPMAGCGPAAHQPQWHHDGQPSRRRSRPATSRKWPLTPARFTARASACSA